MTHNTKSGQPSEIQSTIQLTGNQLNSYRVRRSPIRLHIIEGRAWVTYDNNDVIVESGEIISIPASKHRVIISPPHQNASVAYEIA